MLQLGEGAENRPSAEKHKILRLLGINYFHIHCLVFKYLFSMLNTGCKAEDGKSNKILLTVMDSELRPALFFL